MDPLGRGLRRAVARRVLSRLGMNHLEAIATRNRNPVRFDLTVLAMMMNAILLLALTVAP